MSNSFSPTSRVYNPMSPASSFATLPKRLERKITARWKEWEPWVWMYLIHRGCAPNGSPELAELRERHSGHIVNLMQRGVAMRLVRRHRLDDPRITDELRRVLVRAVMERCSRARLVRQPDAAGDSRTEPSKIEAAPRQVFPSQYSSVPIDLIQKRVSEYFQLRELRNQDLRMRSNRRIITFPRQLAMYIVRQVTTASLQEIGRQFGGMHHTTVLHSINKIEAMRRLDEASNLTIAGLINDLRI